MMNHHTHDEAHHHHHHQDEPAPSTAAIAGHPAHPMIVLFPVAFLVGALATDVVYASVLDPLWAYFSFWLTLAGVATGVLAAALGLIDFWTIERARSHRAGWVHFIGNAIVLVLAGVSLGFRWVEPIDFVVPWGLVVSTVITVLLLITGWYGGELSYRHRIGVLPHHHDGPEAVRFPTEQEQEQRRRSA